MKKLALSWLLISAPVAAQFNPQDLSPHFFISSEPNVEIPYANSECTANETPAWCCTGNQTGTCDGTMASFITVNSTTRDFDCTGSGTPYACCTDVDLGTCSYDNDETARGGLGSDYCPLSICPEGCANQWRSQDKRKSSVQSHGPSGRTFEQDDLELPCYVSSCINGLPCVAPRPPWFEPDYPDNSACVGLDDPYDCCFASGLGWCQPGPPTQMELEPGDRFIGSGLCLTSLYVALLEWYLPGNDEDHWHWWSVLIHDLDGSYRLRTAQAGAPTVVPVGTLKDDGRWHLIEVQRNASNEITVWIDEADVTSAGPPTFNSQGVENFAPTQWGCRTKACTTTNEQGTQHRVAMAFLKCDFNPTTQQQSDLRAWVDNVFDYKREPPFRNGTAIKPTG